MAFKDQTGATALPTLTPSGAVPVEEVGAEGADPLLAALERLAALMETNNLLLVEAHDLKVDLEDGVLN